MSNAGDNLSPDERAQAIVDDAIARRRAGEIVSDDAILAKHPELLGRLEVLFRKAALLGAAREMSSNKLPAMGGNLRVLLQDTDAEPAPAVQPGTESLSASADGSSLVSPPDDPPEIAPPGSSWDSVDEEAEQEADLCEGEHTERITIEESEPASVDVSVHLDPPPPLDTPPREAIPTAESAQPPSTPSTAPPIPGAIEPSTVRLDKSPGFGDTVVFRPSCRPPTAVLRVFDDNQQSGELVRMRGAELTIGRQIGDVTVPHDSLMSGEHARIARERVDGVWAWTLTDLGSTNGVYVKARRIRLRHNDQLIIANRTVRFTQTDGGEGPELQEIRPDGAGEKLVLRGADCWIGRDESVCAPFLATEPMLDSRFARLMHRRDGRWTIWTAQSVNGLWVRVERIKLVGGSMFQLGEQRFSFHTP